MCIEGRCEHACVQGCLPLTSVWTLLQRPEEEVSYTAQLLDSSLHHTGPGPHWLKAGLAGSVLSRSHVSLQPSHTGGLRSQMHTTPEFFPWFSGPPAWTKALLSSMSLTQGQFFSLYSLMEILFTILPMSIELVIPSLQEIIHIIGIRLGHMTSLAHLILTRNRASRVEVPYQGKRHYRLGHLMPTGLLAWNQV